MDVTSIAVSGPIVLNSGGRFTELADGRLVEIWAEEASQTGSTAPDIFIQTVFPDGSPASGAGLLMQRYTADGSNPLDAELRFSDIRDIERLADGGFLVAQALETRDATNDEISAQRSVVYRFDATGQQVGVTLTGGDGIAPRLAGPAEELLVLANGADYVLSSLVSAGRGNPDRVPVFQVAEDGVPSDPAILIDISNPNTGDTDSVKGIETAQLTNGNLVHVYPYKDDAVARVTEVRFIVTDENVDTIVGDQNVAMRASEDTRNRFVDADVAALVSGGFVVSSIERLVAPFPVPGEPTRLTYQLFDAAGMPVGPEDGVAINTLAGRQSDVVALPDGGFFLTWREGVTRIAGQQFDAEGDAVGDRIQIENDEGLGLIETKLSGDGTRIFVSAAQSDGADVGQSDPRLLYTLDFRNGALAIEGDPGPEILTGTPGDDTLGALDAQGDDTLLGLEGTDMLIGGEGHNLLRGAAGNDTLIGWDGDDTLDGGAGIDRLVGAQGSDRYLVDDTRDVVSETRFTDGLDQVISTANFSLIGSHVETLTLQDTAQIAIGNALDNQITGNSADNRLHGRQGDDTLFGGQGADLLIGGEGSDVFHVDDVGDRVGESRNWQGVDLVISSVDFALGRQHVENLTLTGGAVTGAGNGLANVITGSTRDNVLDGGGGSDTLVGARGDDTYIVRSGRDVVVEKQGEGRDIVKAFGSHKLAENVEILYLQTVFRPDGSGVDGLNGIGNAENNVIVGTPFENTLIGREGRDTLKGQAGADRFVFDRVNPGGEGDRIVDFNLNEADEGDMLWLKGAIFGDLAAGDLDPAVFFAGREATEAGHRLLFDAEQSALRFDADGTGPIEKVLITTFSPDEVVTPDDIFIF